jgi:hypothetical protein
MLTMEALADGLALDAIDVFAEINTRAGALPVVKAIIPERISGEERLLSIARIR